jgi:anaerobic selenocysteine-containing dehydrogenase
MWPGVGYSRAYGQYTPAIVDAPAGSDLIEEWDFFYGLAKRQGVPLHLYPIRAEAGPIRTARKPLEINMENKPTTDELMELLFEGSRIPLSELKKHPGGGTFDEPGSVVAPKERGWEGKLELADTTMISELLEVRDENLETGPEDYPFRLVSRRVNGVYNSSGRDLPSFMRKATHNPAFMNPDDLAELGIGAGDVVQIRSDHGSILGVVTPEAELRRGVISMTHAFGDAPDRDAEFREIGSTTGRLINCQNRFDPYSGIPRMSSIEVQVKLHNP